LEEDLQEVRGEKIMTRTRKRRRTRIIRKTRRRKRRGMLKE
jgi:hypothetical protein